MQNPPAYSVYQELEKNIDMLSNEDAGILYKAQNKYFFHGEPPDFTSSSGEGLKYTWPTIESKLTRDKRNYALKCVKKAYAADMKQFTTNEEKLSYAAWFEWRAARFRNCIDPILEGFTIEDMIKLDSEKAYKDTKKSSDTTW